MSRMAGKITGGDNTGSGFLNAGYADTDMHFRNSYLEIIAGSCSRNIIYSAENNSDKGWVIAGTGLISYSGSTVMMDQQDWDNVISAEDPESVLHGIDGHFAAIRWDNDSVRFYTDVTGLRDIYILVKDDSIYFSTDPLTLAGQSGCDIDFEEFASRWLLFNQVSHNSIFSGMRRLVAGSSARVTFRNRLQISYRTYPGFTEPKSDFLSAADFSQKLESLINITPPGKQISLSLSGGMDSRVLLSYLLKTKNDRFETHTFGDPGHPDSLIASEITERFSLNHHQFNSGIPGIDDCINGIGEFSASTLVNNAASAFLQLQNYKLINGEESVLIDGGFGEIWRREFFYKLWLQGKKALIGKNVKGIIPHLMLHRADIFNDEVKILMQRGVEKQIEEALTILPEPTAQNLTDWLDLFAIRTRLPNYYGQEQTRLDNHLTAVMPFIQPSLLRNILRIPERNRKNGRLFREIIRTNQPQLAKLRLAKGDGTYPFYLNTLQVRLLSKLRSRLRLKKHPSENNTRLLLMKMKDFIHDSIGSENFRSAPFYDHKKITGMVDSYYKGDHTNEYDLDWFLSFEVFRQMLKKVSKRNSEHQIGCVSYKLNTQK
ncbi:MAG: asparagine synthase-related protein [Ignavibacteriaceae bacterium]|nr:asparagine synthase-related protein [Ignavibacteriaceae bacterium]